MDRAAAGAWTDGRGAEATGQGDVVEAMLAWNGGRSGTVVEVRRVAKGAALTIGEHGDLIVPYTALGALRVEVVRHDVDGATVFVPDGARLRVDGEERSATAVALDRGSCAEIVVGDFALRVTRDVAGLPRFLPPLEAVRESGAGYMAGSAAFHAAVFAMVALFCPPLGATEEDPIDRDRLALMQHLLNAAAEREADRPPEPTGGGGEPASPASPAAGPQGLAGRRDAPSSHGRLAATPHEDPGAASGARQRELAEAADFGAVRLLASLQDLSDRSPAWDRGPAGRDTVDVAGHLFDTGIGEAYGTGLGLSGPGTGGGGPAGVIGLGQLSGVGDPGGRGGHCAGPGPCDGIGDSFGHHGRGHVPRFKSPRYASDPIINGRLPPEVIQRVVRMNDGRYRACYERGLRANPSLTGRVTVKFVVDRTGAVALASDGGSDIPDDDVKKCVISAFGALSFPAPENGMLTVVYPIAFSPE